MRVNRHLISTHKALKVSVEIELVRARSGAWTAEVREANSPPFHLHSQYDPEKEAALFIGGQIRYLKEELPEKIVIYGAGCGHHIQVLVDQLDTRVIAVEVWETNVDAFLEAKEKGVYQRLLENDKVTFIVSDDLKDYVKRVGDWERDNIQVIIHGPSLKIMPPELAPLREVLQDYQIRKNSAVAFRHLLDANFEANAKTFSSGVSPFLQLPTVPLLLISAGPSLSRSYNQLRSAYKHCLLGAVGTAMAPLVENGINPDFAVMTDPQPNMVAQLKGWETKNVPLFFLSTLNYGVVEGYRGPKYILFQEGYIPAEAEAARRGEPLVNTGGSVATTLFSLARLLRLSPICLVGQDLAYTNNMTHVKGSAQQLNWVEQAQGEQVLAFDRKGTVISPRNLLLYKKWFEEQARESKETFYNATEGGAYIEGFSHLKLKDFLDKVGSIDATQAREKFRQIVRSTTN